MNSDVIEHTYTELHNRPNNNGTIWTNNTKLTIQKQQNNNKTFQSLRALTLNKTNPEHQYFIDIRLKIFLRKSLILKVTMFVVSFCFCLLNKMSPYPCPMTSFKIYFCEPVMGKEFGTPWTSTITTITTKYNWLRKNIYLKYIFIKRINISEH